MRCTTVVSCGDTMANYSPLRRLDSCIHRCILYASEDKKYPLAWGYSVAGDHGSLTRFSICSVIGVDTAVWAMCSKSWSCRSSKGSYASPSHYVECRPEPPKRVNHLLGCECSIGSLCRHSSKPRSISTVITFPREA